MIGVLLAVCAATGAHLVFTAVVDGRRAVWASGGRATVDRVTRWRATLVVRLGLEGVRWRELVLTTVGLALVAGLVGLAAFGAPLPASVMALSVGSWPLASQRLRRQQLLAAAHDAWPRIVEQVRVETTELGRSIPQALFEAGRSAPAELHPAFQAAQREWTLSTDLERALDVLKRELADATADAACETLLVAHQVGGTDLDARLAGLIEDRTLDVQSRKDARSRQAGVRFARRFVLLVPCGMALAGMTIGSGRAAYQTGWGQTLVALGVASVGLCWVWSGRLLRLPAEERVFR